MKYDTDSYGLIFERNRTEDPIIFYRKEIKRNCIVSPKDNLQSFYLVLSVKNNCVKCRELSLETIEYFKSDELFVVARPKIDTVIQYLKLVDSISTDADHPENQNMLIAGENLHALQLLNNFYKHKVDCIYIDPPYNTGATHWKYCNKFKDSSNIYPHSSWLDFMEKRLLAAKQLLNPEDSTLIVTIDEKQVHHLGLLLEQVFPEAQIQMVTSVIRPGGQVRVNRFSRVEEYLYFVFIGKARVCCGNSNMLNSNTKVQNPWYKMIRSGFGSLRSQCPNLFYPIFFDKDTGEYVGTGKKIPLNVDRNTVKIPKNCFAVWPIKRKTGEEARWQLSRKVFLEKLRKGFIRFGRYNARERHVPIYYITSGVEKAIERGEARVVSGKDGLPYIEDNSGLRPFTVWNHPLHNAGDFGSTLLVHLLGERRFTYPKSLYAVKDTLRFILKDKPNALVLDFFAGSGTTLHAVNLLNEEDGGNRRCIMVTNNEVSAKERANLLKGGYTPSDNEWRRLGIAHHVTWPRTVASITGRNATTQLPIKEKYADTERLVLKGLKSNANFFQLEYTTKPEKLPSEKIIPHLWLKSGAIGNCPNRLKDNKYFISSDHNFSVLFDTNAFRNFLGKLTNSKYIYIITDDKKLYVNFVSRLKRKGDFKIKRIDSEYIKENFTISSIPVWDTEKEYFYPK